jgi:large subunit ribosomal protein L25
MAVQIYMKVKLRESAGKGANRKLRREGFTPAILYGNREKSLPICFNTTEFLKQTQGGVHENLIFNLEVSDTPQQEAVEAIIKEMQIEPVTDKVVHIDFYELVRDRAVTVEIPIEAVGEARGVKVGGGILEHVMREIAVECLPRLIPDSIKVDVSDLDAGEAIHVQDLQVPEGITILEDPARVVFTIGQGTKTTAAPAVEAETSESE